MNRTPLVVLWPKDEALWSGQSRIHLQSASDLAGLEPDQCTLCLPREPQVWKRLEAQGRAWSCANAKLH